MAPSFDRYVVVDWSAAGRPTTGADSIWVADLAAGCDDATLANPPTRRLAGAAIDHLLRCGRRDGVRTLLAIDVALGFPAGSAEALGLVGGPPWAATWTWLGEHVVDDERNRNNRFEVAAALNRRVATPGPFWGCPPSQASAALASTKPDRMSLPEYRAVDRRLHDGGRHPFSIWQLLGVGSVGSQSLTALPVLHRLVERHEVQVWPFTTGLRLPDIEPGRAVLAEVWPSGFDLDIPGHWVRDAGQVDRVARLLRSVDRAGELAEWWQPDAPDRPGVVEEEGWILGVT